MYFCKSLGGRGSVGRASHPLMAGPVVQFHMNISNVVISLGEKPKRPLVAADDAPCVDSFQIPNLDDTALLLVYERGECNIVKWRS